MNKKYVYILVGVGVCLGILALSLGLYFGLREDHQDTYQPVTQPPTTKDPVTQLPTTQEPQHPVMNNGSQRTALDDFVYSEDSLNQFSWFHSDNFDFNGTSVVTNGSYSAYVINITSGYWQTEEEVGERNLWWHIFLVIIPNNLRQDYQSNGYIYVSGGSNTRDDGTGMPNINDDDNLFEASAMATGIGLPVAVLYQVPNQPIYFANDPTNERRTEDEIIAYTWAMYLNDMTHPELNAYFAMVRAAIRSTDAMSQFMEQEFGFAVERFIFTGKSKRGWTSWLSGAIAPEKVRAIVPCVWDGINLQEVFQNQWQSFKGWSWTIVDYVENNITSQLGSPDTFELQNMIDPYFYRTRLTMPKLVITGLMDEFQMTDDEQHWWDGMPSGPTGQGLSDGNSKWLLKLPNANHGTTNIPALFSHGMWISYLLNEWDIPYLTWDYNGTNGDITAHTHGGNVVSASMWYATSCNNTRRDFRAATLDDPCTCGTATDDGICIMTDTAWSEKKLEPNSDGTSYTGHLAPPEDGKWSSFVVLIQMTTDYTEDLNNSKHTYFTKGGNNIIDLPLPIPTTPPGVFQFTSRASVVPNNFPYSPCYMEGCDGPLV